MQIINNNYYFDILIYRYDPWGNRVSECWMFYAVPTARVIFTAKTSLDLFSLR